MKAVRPVWLYLSIALNLLLAGVALYTFNYFWETLRDQAHERTTRLRLQVEAMDYRPTDIVFAGDSLIAEGRWSYWFPDRDILNLGIDGTTTYNLFYRGHQVSRVHPHKIFIMVGINDLNYQDLTVSADELVEFSGKVMERMRSENPDAEIYMHSVLPTNSPWPRRFGAEVIGPVNDKIAALAQERGVAFVDLASLLTGPDGYLDMRYSDDGLHLNAEGYRVWVELIRPLVVVGERAG